MINLRFADYPFTKILGWSNSRYDLFCSCKRKYLYSYYPKSFGNLEYKIKNLKNLTSVPLEVGNLYHDIMEVFLERMQESNAPINKEKLFAFIDNLCLNKLSQKVFFEKYYGTAEVDFAQICAKIKSCVEIFLNSPTFEWIKSIDTNERKLWLVEAGSKMNGKKYFGETKIGGLKAYCKMDFIFIKDDKIHIVDWKTGQKDEARHKKQLLGYAVAAKTLSEQLKASDILPKAVYVNGAYDELKLTVCDKELDDFAEIVAKETKEMQAYCSNVEENLPQATEIFEKCQRPNFCRLCEFQELCQK
ncbi:MAG: PD-(D/E)XK nuclease family protein [Chitinivibrionia bacterium]|nr:PD-(D/E)XK nuclease family protein [Chitinivibrionia bacterium]